MKASLLPAPNSILQSPYASPLMGRAMPSQYFSMPSSAVSSPMVTHSQYFSSPCSPYIESNTISTASSPSLPSRRGNLTHEQKKLIELSCASDIPTFKQAKCIFDEHRFSPTKKILTRNSIPYDFIHIKECPKLKDKTIGILDGQDASIQSSEKQRLSCRENVAALILDNSGLPKLPSSTSKLFAIESMILSNNQLSNLPQTLFEDMSRLTKLSASKNQISSLPPSIGNAYNLVSLSLNENQLTSLPPSFSLLKTLCHLDLSKNQFSHIPSEIGSCVELTELSFYDNQIEKVPAELKELKKLAILNLNRNCISSISMQFYQLTQLKKLYLSTNRISRLPLLISNLTRLKALSLADNCLADHDIRLHTLAHLSTLRLDQNSFTLLPKSISALTSLRSFSICDNPLISRHQIRACLGLRCIVNFLKEESCLERNDCMTYDEARIPGYDMEVRFEELSNLEDISSSRTASIKKGLWRGKRVAVKLMSQHQNSEVLRLEFVREFEIFKLLQKAKDSFVVELFGVCTEPGRCCLIMEYMESGSLFHYLRTPGLELSLYLQVLFALQTSEAVQALHNNHPHPIIHRDIKSENFLVSQTGGIKICDFGLSRGSQSTQDRPIEASYMEAVSCYSAPEVLTRQDFSKSSDVFSLGMVFWEILTLRTPFSSTEEARERIMQNNMPEVPEDCPKWFKKLIQRCWCVQKQKRPDIKQITEILWQKSRSANKFSLPSDLDEDEPDPAQQVDPDCAIDRLETRFHP